MAFYIVKLFLLYIDFLTILFSFNLLVKLVRLSLVFKGNLTWLDLKTTTAMMTLRLLHIWLVKALSTLATIVAEFDDCRQKRRLSPNSATKSCQCGQGLRRNVGRTVVRAKVTKVRCVCCVGRFANDTTDLLPTCCELVADLLAICYGETSVMDFGLIGLHIGEAGLWLKPVSGVLYSSREPSELWQWLYHDDSILMIS